MMHLAFLFLLIAPAVQSAAVDASDDLPPADEITINRASTSGSGCPRRTVSCDISSDRTIVTLGFDEFQTFIGRGRAAADRDKNCEIHLNLHYPGGYTFAVVDATYHRFAQLDNGVNASLSSTYSFQTGRAAAGAAGAGRGGGAGGARGRGD